MRHPRQGIYVEGWYCPALRTLPASTGSRFDRSYAVKTAGSALANDIHVLAELVLAAGSVTVALRTAKEDVVDAITLDDLLRRFPARIPVQTRNILRACPGRLGVGRAAPLALVIFPAEQNRHTAQRRHATVFRAIGRANGLHRDNIVSTDELIEADDGFVIIQYDKGRAAIKGQGRRAWVGDPASFDQRARIDAIHRKQKTEEKRQRRYRPCCRTHASRWHRQLVV